MPALRPVLAAVTTCCLLALSAATAHASAVDAPIDPLISASQCPNSDAGDLDARRAAAAIRCLSNAARVGAGVAPLQDSAELAAIARARRQLLLACDDFSHTPCGHHLTDDAGDYLRPARTWAIGENLQWRSSAAVTPRRVVSNWLGSPHHRRNLLAPNWRQQAVAIASHVTYQGAARASLWVQWFGRRAVGGAR